MHRRSFLLAATTILATPVPLKAAASGQKYRVTYFEAEGVIGSRDVTPAPDGETIWVLGRRNGVAGRFDPRDRSMRIVRLGEGSAPHGVVIGPDKAAWITDSGQNAIARIDNETHTVDLFRLPPGQAIVELNTGVFDKSGTYWFTGQNGYVGRLDPKTGTPQVWEAPRGPGPYGITCTPRNEVWYASLGGNYIARLDRQTLQSEIVEPPIAGQGARRVWSDSKGKVWVSEYNSGNVSVFDPATKSWRYWKLPGQRPHPYAIYVDDRDIVWLSDFGANAIVRFDPQSQSFESFPSTKPSANVRQLDGRPGEVWGGESAQNRLVRIETLMA